MKKLLRKWFPYNYAQIDDFEHISPTQVKVCGRPAFLYRPDSNCYKQWRWVDSGYPVGDSVTCKIRSWQHLYKQEDA